jgi:transcription initiation factor TFIIIB Brf1 subunit/transcription initiation factor TFIIB
MTDVIELAWSELDLIRKTNQKDEPVDLLSEFFCSCGGQKAFGVDFDLPTCISCGMQDKTFICQEAEYRTGADESSGPDPTRVGAVVNTDHFSEQWGGNTKITVAHGGTYSQKKMARIHMHGSMNHRDRALFHAYAEIDHICKNILNLQDNIVYITKIKYKAFNEAVLTRGDVRKGVKANCVFQTCREHNVPRTTQEIADAFGIPVKDISRTFDIYQEQNPETQVHVITPSKLVARFMNDISIPEQFKGRVVRKIVNVCESLDDCVSLMGRTPRAVCCAVMFIVLSSNKEGYDVPTRAELCKICDISVPTLAKIEIIVKNSLKDLTS